MACPLCFGVGFFGGMIGEKFFGIDKPATRCGRIVANLTNSTLVVLTFIAIKKIFKVSVCAVAKTKFGKVLLVGTEAIALGTLYAIPVNKLCSKIFNPKIATLTPSCCCSKQKMKCTTASASANMNSAKYFSPHLQNRSSSKTFLAKWIPTINIRSWMIYQLFV